MLKINWEDKMAFAMLLIAEACDQSNKEEIECYECSDHNKCLTENKIGCGACPMNPICDLCIDAYDETLSVLIKETIANTEEHFMEEQKS